MNSCVFCDYKNDEHGTIIFENDFCVCIEQNDKILIGSCMVIPKAHKVTAFYLDSNEWDATKQLLDKAKSYLDDKYNPDGYNIGWNCGATAGQTVSHAHMHIIPRYADEPYAGRGIRSWIKREENARTNKYE